MMEIVKIECDAVDYSNDINSLIRANGNSNNLNQPCVGGPIPCPQCGKLFAKEFDIKRHMFTHTGEKPFKCDVCGRGFSQKSTLKVHYNIHTGEMPYECRMCLKKFRQKQGLNAHVKANRCQMGAIRPEREIRPARSSPISHTGPGFSVNDIQSIAAQVTAKVNDFKVENVLTLEAIKKLISSPMTIKVNNNKKRVTSPDLVNENDVPFHVSNISDDLPTLTPKQTTRPIDLSLLSNGFSNFLKKVEGHSIATPNNCEMPVDDGSLTARDVTLGPSPPPARKEINTSLSEMEKNQIIRDVKHVDCRRTRRKQANPCRLVDEV